MLQSKMLRLKQTINPNPNDLFLLKECGYAIGDSVWIRPNSSDWSGDWSSLELTVIGVRWNTRIREWQFDCCPIDESDDINVLYELDMDDLTRFNLWE